MKKIIDKIIHSRRSVFSVNMLGNYLGEKDDVVLRKKISYAVKTGYLERIARGIYTVKGMQVNTKELTNMIYSPSYISFETGLYHHGIIFQANPNQVDIAYKKSDTRYIETVDVHIKMRAMKEDILLSLEGLEYKDNYTIATAERAFLDMLYLHKNYHFDNLEILDVAKIQNLIHIYKKDTMMQSRLESYFLNT